MGDLFYKFFNSKNSGSDKLKPGINGRLQNVVNYVGFGLFDVLV
jgi:hypothetical protein